MKIRRKHIWITSLKFKSALFLTALLLGVLVLLCALILHAVQQNQHVQLEGELASIARSANVMLGEQSMNSDSKRFLADQTDRLIQRASSNRAANIAIYDAMGNLVDTNGVGKISVERKVDQEKGVQQALEQKIAYVIRTQSVFYFAPLYRGEQVIGVIQINYDYSQYKAFYEDLKSMMLYTGSAVFLVSLILALLYFERVSKCITSLGVAIESVEQGDYKHVDVLKRQDELGKLSLGIKRMSETIEEAVGALKRERDHQRMFFGRITHEFKTPLSVINAYNDLAEMYADDAELNANAHIQIKREVEQLNKMVEKALELSKLEKQDFELSWTQVHLKTLLENCMERLSAKAVKYSIMWEKKLSDVSMRGDQDILEQVLMNVLDNAIKYNVENGKIWVVCDTSGIRIENSGHGFSPEVKERLFEAYAADDQNNLTSVKGTGLGLGLVRHLVNMHHGEITIGDAETAHQLQGMKGGAVSITFSDTSWIHRGHNRDDLTD